MENRYLLISDLDGTLLGDDDALEEFAAWLAPRREWMGLVYNSGRFFDSVLQSIESTPLPEPDAVIGGVGSEIRAFESGQSIGAWLDDCNDWQPLRICSLLAEYDEIALQPAEFLSDHKISYYAENAAPELLDELARRLTDAGCCVELLYSSNRDLDVLPRGVNKGTAASYLAAHWSYGSRRVIVSGDSGNDLAMFEQDFRGIVVANAHGELKRLGGESVFHAQQPHAAGVLEGLSHWLA